MGKVVTIYARASSRMGAAEQRDSKTRQFKLCEDLACRFKLKVTDRVFEVASGIHHLDLRKALADAISKSDIILIDTARAIARDPGVSEAIRSTAKASCCRIVSGESPWSPDEDESPASTFVRRIFDAFYAYERDCILARLNSGKKKAASLGKRWCGRKAKLSSAKNPLKVDR